MPVVQKGRGATNYAQRGMGVKLKEGSGGPSIDLIDLSVTNNGEWTASSGQAYKKVTVNVPSPQLITLSATTNGSWTASAGQAYKTVTVNVPPGVNVVSTTINGNGGSLNPGYTTPLNTFDNLIPKKLTLLVADGDIVDQSEVGSSYSFDNNVFMLDSTSILIAGDELSGVQVILNPVNKLASVSAYSEAEGYTPDYSSFRFSIIQYVFN